jgi:HD-like signal output (HDOD) protein
MLNTTALKNRLSGKLSLPSLPEIVLGVQEAVADPNRGPGEIGQMIAEDPPLAARVLRIANSAYYSVSVPVLDIRHASAILGMDALQSVVMQASIANLFSNLRPDQKFDPRELWQHAVLTARLMTLAPQRFFKGLTSAEAFITGLLHDIGKFVLFDHLRSEFVEAVIESQTSGRPIQNVEREAFGFTHADVGRLIAERWHMPCRIVCAIGEHHDHKLAQATDQLTALLAAADHIACESFKWHRAQMVRPVPRKIIDRLELTQEEIQAWIALSLELQREG